MHLSFAVTPVCNLIKLEETKTVKSIIYFVATQIDVYPCSLNQCTLADTCSFYQTFYFVL